MRPNSDDLPLSVNETDVFERQETITKQRKTGACPLETKVWICIAQGRIQTPTKVSVHNIVPLLCMETTNISIGRT